MGRELGRFLEQRRHELGLSRRDLAERSGLSYPYVSQLETGDREPAIKAMRALSPVLDVRLDQLAGLVAGGAWSDTGSTYAAMAAPPPSYEVSPSEGSAKREKVLLSVERRLREIPPVERISLLNELIAQAVHELRSAGGSPGPDMR